MFQDICFPQNNEKMFIEIAKKLGTKFLIFVYEYKDKKSFEKQKKTIEAIQAIKSEIGILVDEKNISKIPRDIEYIFTKSPTRQIIENKNSHILYGFEAQEKKDFIHHRNSGLNQVLCTLIKEKKKILGFSLSTLINSNNPGVMLGRMKQNVRLALKYKLITVVASFAEKPYELRAEHEVKSFERMLGF